MTGIVPDREPCEECGSDLEEEDGYVMIDEASCRHRFCDECPTWLEDPT